jgi:proteasome lid subunit RPN8/RPN11
LSYVSIWKPVYDKIVNASTESSRVEIIGLLLGNLENDTVIITDSVTGEFSGEPHRVILYPATIAKIADDMLKGRLKGNIVGWYHSHTDGGVFFSQTDIETQRRFQQFSRLTLGMVVDAANGNVGFFRIDGNDAVKIPQDRLKVYEKTAATQLAPQPMLQTAIRRKMPQRKILGIMLIALALSMAIMGGVLYRSGSPANPRILHNNPILATVVGSSIPISANVTGVVDMTLFYALDGGSFTQVAMASNRPGEFQYTLSGSQVTSNLTYYMEGTTGSGAKLTTRPYQIRVSDFALQTEEGMTVYRNSTKPTITKVNLIAINGFANSVTLSASRMPNGVSVSFPSSQSTPGAVLNMSVSADANTPIQTFPLYVSASYESPGTQIITRRSKILITVTDFDLQINPSTLMVDQYGQASFAMNVTLGQGFSAPLKLTVTGLPEGAKVLLGPSTGTISLTGPSVTLFNLQATTLKQGTYTVVLNVAATLQNGDSISHSRSIQLTVR